MALEQWNEILRRPDYWKYSPEDRALIKTGWFEKNIAPTPDFKAYSTDDQNTIQEYFSRPEEYVGYDRGIVSDIISRAARGGLRLMESVGGALRMSDIDPTEERGLLARTGKAITERAEDIGERYDIFRPDIAEAMGREGFIKRGVTGAVESTIPSLAPLAGGILGAKVGALIGTAIAPGPGTAAGALIGGAIGGLGTLFATFGLGQYQTTYDETMKELRAQGVPEAEAEQKAKRNALISATAEAGGEFIGDIAAITFFGVLGRRAISQSLKQTIRQLLGGGKKEFAKALAKTIPFEVGSEMGTAYFQAKAAQEAGVSTLPPGEAIAEAVLPAIFLSLLFGGAVHGMQTIQARGLYRALNSEDPEQRIGAVQAVAGRMKDEADRNLWLDTASAYIQSGESIPIDRPIVDFAIQKTDVEEAPARKEADFVLDIEDISKATTVDEAVAAFEKATQPAVSALAAEGLREELTAVEAARGPEAPGLPAVEAAETFQAQEVAFLTKAREVGAMAPAARTDEVITRIQQEGSKLGIDPGRTNQAIIDGMTGEREGLLVSRMAPKPVAEAAPAVEKPVIEAEPIPRVRPEPEKPVVTPPAPVSKVEVVPEKIPEAVKPELPKPIGSFIDKRPGKPPVEMQVLSLTKPRNVRGKLSGLNWAVDYETPSTLGPTGKQTNTEYFSKKVEAQEWIDSIRKKLPVKPAITPEKKAIATDKSVRDHPQQAVIVGDTITINMKLGRKTVFKYDIPVSEWEATERHPNPDYAKMELIGSYTEDLDEQPGGPGQAQRIRDSQILAIQKAFEKKPKERLSLDRKAALAAEITKAKAKALALDDLYDDAHDAGRRAEEKPDPVAILGRELTKTEKTEFDESYEAGKAVQEAISAKRIREREGPVVPEVPEERREREELPEEGEAPSRDQLLVQAQKERERRGVEKEPWEMTKGELAVEGNLSLAYSVAHGKFAMEDVAPDYKKDIERLIPIVKDLETLGPGASVAGMEKFFRSQIIRKALREGKSVPAEVLADYPDLAKEEEPVHDYSSTQVRLPDDIADDIKAFAADIPDEDIYTEPDEDYGREEIPHITVRYGIGTDDLDKIIPAFEKIGPITGTMDVVNIFTDPEDYDVVVVQITSDDLEAANEAVGKTVDLPGEKFPDYKPHATIAYVEKGKGRAYLNMTTFEGREFTINEIEFSTRTGESHFIKLKEPKTFAEMAEAEARIEVEKEVTAADIVTEKTTKVEEAKFRREVEEAIRKPAPKAKGPIPIKPGQRAASTKEFSTVKDKFLKEIDEAIKKAEDVTAFRDVEKAGFVKFTDPFGAEFEVINSKKTLQDFKKAYKFGVKRTPDKIIRKKPSKPSVTKPATKESWGPDIAKVEGAPGEWITDGQVLLKQTDEKVVKEKGDLTRPGKAKFDWDTTKKYISPKDELVDTTLQYYVSPGEAGVSVSMDPVVNVLDEYQKWPLAVFKVGDKFYGFQQGHLNIITNRYPNAEFKIEPQDDYAKLQIYDKGDIVGVILQPKGGQDIEQLGLKEAREFFRDPETGRPRFAAAPTGPQPITLSLADVQDIFKGQRVLEVKEGSIVIQTRGNQFLVIREVEQLIPDEVAYKINYGKDWSPTKKGVAGGYDAGTIKLSRAGRGVNRYVLRHEQVHWLEDTGILSKFDIELLRGHIKKEAKAGTWDTKNAQDIGGEEDRAWWISRQLEGIPGVRPKTIDRIIFKIEEWIDRLVNVFQRTAYGVARDIGAGRIYGVPGEQRGLLEGTRYQEDVWHGSPYEFDRFTTEKIGTGEGAQAFGWGLYFTEKEDIARHYASQLSLIKKLNIPSSRRRGAKLSSVEIKATALAKKVYHRNLGYYDLSIPVTDFNDLIEFYNYRQDLGALDRAYYIGNKEKIDKKLQETRDTIKAKNPSWSKEKIEKSVRWAVGDIEKPHAAAYDEATKALNDEYGISRNLYQVTLHEGKEPSEYTWLDWDKSVRGQGSDVLDKLRVTLKERGFTDEQIENRLGRKEDVIALPWVKKILDDVEKNGGKRSTAIDLIEDLVDGYNEGRWEGHEMWTYLGKYTDEDLNQFHDYMDDRKEGESGQSLYASIASMYGEKEASLLLLKHGIDGIRYPEGTLSGRPGKGFNYVVFDEAAVTITQRTQYAVAPDIDPIISEVFDTHEKSSVATAVRGVFSTSEWTRSGAKDYLSKQRTAFIDRLHPVEQLGRTPYLLHRMLGNAHLVISSFLQHGNLSWKDQALIVETKDKGFLPWLEKLGDDARPLFYWIAVKRATILEKEGRENWLTPEKRKQILAVLFKGLSENARLKKMQKFNQLNKEFQAWNKNIIEIARESGLLNVEQINAWTRDFYLPFYRLLEDETVREDFLSGPVKSKRHISAQIRRLKGGEEKLGDPVENILRNWSHLIQESQRNMARRAAAEVSVPMGLAEEVPNSELVKILGSRTELQWGVKKFGATRASRLFDDKIEAQMYLQKRAKPEEYEVVERKTTQVMFGRKEDFQILSYQRNGETVYLRVADPDLFEALSEINVKAFDSSLMKIMGGAKRILTITATFGAAFRVANLLRDTLHTAVVSKSFVPLVDSMKGLAKVWQESPEYVALMSSGGGFGKGWVESGDPKAMERAIQKIVKLEGEGARNFILDSPRKLWDFWERVGHASEMAARVELYSTLTKKGVGHLEAAFEARDLLDFHLTGAANAVRVTVAVVPFLNARIQGMDRMYRGAKDNPLAFFVKGSLVAGASLMLWALFKDDERYKELEDWDKWQYHHFWIGDQHWRVPKAFEVGAIFSSLFETTASLIDGQEDGKFFMAFLAHSLTQTFAVNLPAAVAPIAEVFANKSMFTGRPIENLAMQKLPPGERARPWTPEILKALGKGTNVSPVMMQQIIRGYTATMGTMFITMADAFYRFVTDAPDRPAMRIQDIPALGRFARSEVGGTKYATRFYEYAREVEELSATLNNYKAVGDYQKARKMAREFRSKLRYKRLINATNQRLRVIRRREKIVWASRTMSARAKRQELEMLQRRKNEVYLRAYERIKAK